jgi:uncharacterized coiled-coil protein SlyX
MPKKSKARSRHSCQRQQFPKTEESFHASSSDANQDSEEEEWTFTFLDSPKKPPKKPSGVHAHASMKLLEEQQARIEKLEAELALSKDGQLHLNRLIVEQNGEIDRLKCRIQELSLREDNVAVLERRVADQDSVMDKLVGDVNTALKHMGQELDHSHQSIEDLQAEVDALRSATQSGSVDAEVLDVQVSETATHKQHSSPKSSPSSSSLACHPESTNPSSCPPSVSSPPSHRPDSQAASLAKPFTRDRSSSPTGSSPSRRHSRISKSTPHPSSTNNTTAAFVSHAICLLRVAALLQTLCGGNLPPIVLKWPQAVSTMAI